MHNDRVAQLEHTSPSRTMRLLIGMLLLVALGMLAYRGLYRGFFAGTDFGLYYCSTIAMIQTGDPYSPDALRELAEQRGAPTSVIENAIAPPICYTPLIPFAVMPWEAARILWALVNTFSIFMLWYWLAGLAQIPRNQLSPRLLGLAAIVAGFAPLQTNIAYGQLAVTSSAAIIGSIALSRHGKTHAAAILFVLGGLLKPQLATAFGLYWLYKRDWRVLGLTAGYGLVITLLTLAWLQLINPLWLEAWQSNLHRLTSGGGASDYTREGSFIFADLRVPMYAIFQSKPIAATSSWLATIAMGIWAYVRVRNAQPTLMANSSESSLHDLRVAGLISCLGMLPIYHVYYDMTILLIPVTWAIAVLIKERAWQALVVLLLIAPMLIPGQSLLNHLEQRRILPPTLIESHLYQWFVLPHLPWLTIGITACMIAYRRPNILSEQNKGLLY